MSLFSSSALPEGSRPSATQFSRTEHCPFVCFGILQRLCRVSRMRFVAL